MWPDCDNMVTSTSVRSEGWRNSTYFSLHLRHYESKLRGARSWLYTCPVAKHPKESIDWWFYAPNWIMGKTMATTECRSVTGAIKELTTIQKKKDLTLLQLQQQKHSKQVKQAAGELRTHETQTQVKLVRIRRRTCTTKQTTAHLRSSRYDGRRGVGDHKTGRWGSGGLHKIPEPHFFEHMRVFVFLLTLVHTIGYSVKKETGKVK